MRKTLLLLALVLVVRNPAEWNLAPEYGITDCKNKRAPHFKHERQNPDRVLGWCPPHASRLRDERWSGVVTPDGKVQ